MHDSNSDKMCVLVLNLPQRIVDKIDASSKILSLKRGPTARIYLVKALEEYKEQWMEVLSSLGEQIIPGEENMLLSMQITGSTNIELEELRRKLPFSKKRLSELLILKAVRDELV